MSDPDPWTLPSPAFFLQLSESFPRRNHAGSGGARPSLHHTPKMYLFRTKLASPPFLAFRVAVAFQPDLGPVLSNRAEVNIFTLGNLVEA